MSLTLIVAILFTVAALVLLAFRTRRTWWLLPLACAAGAIVNWLRWFEVIHL